MHKMFWLITKFLVILKFVNLNQFGLGIVNDKSTISSIEVQKKIVYEFEEYWLDIFSFTFDNWLENVNHTQLHKYWINTYFCDTYSSWQKWTVENMNSLIRQYLPRNIDLLKLTLKDLQNIQEKINNRPRKCLNYLSANEFFYKETWVDIWAISLFKDK